MDKIENAEGAAIRLLDGRTLDLKYGMRSLIALEDRFGSTAAVVRAFDAEGAQRPIGMVVDMIACGLRHHEISEDELVELLDPKRLAEYGEAAVTALNAALGHDAGAAASSDVGPLELLQQKAVSGLGGSLGGV